MLLANHIFIFFKFFNSLNLVFEFDNSFPEILLFLFQSLAYLLLESTFPLDNLVSDVIEEFRNIGAVPVSRFFKAEEVLFYLHDLGENLAFLLHGLFDAHIEEVNLLLDRFLHGQNLVVLMILLENTINTEDLLVQITKSFNFLSMLLADLPLTERMILPHGLDPIPPLRHRKIFLL